MPLAGAPTAISEKRSEGEVAWGEVVAADGGRAFRQSWGADGWVEASACGVPWQLAQRLA